MSSIKKILVVVGLAALIAAVWTADDEAKARQVVAALVAEAETGRLIAYEVAQ
ncbi:hypothetical protein [Lampropedia aestuarii]|uniref:hypothetical protein n=1 Tax=Lampropedia aestuarii TaxID=2562762 RepID=UPI00246942FF|nr:hypothetical protein [Lampropedia aestuarii]MDH5857768.1 hypothetical protein [Lampropedia aestuarii]